jgi:hypothetical protein
MGNEAPTDVSARSPNRPGGTSYPAATCASKTAPIMPELLLYYEKMGIASRISPLDAD